jgi:hypothetical protein
MQYGSHPGKQHINAVLNKQLTYDIVHQSKSTTAFIENDAVGFFDHLINPLLLLQLKQLGAPSSTTSSLSSTWATTHFRTQFGISEETYKYSQETPLFGPGQGSMIGPFLWLLCFCLITNILGSSPAMNFFSMVQTVSISNTGDAFVIDSYLGATSTHSPFPDKSISSNGKPFIISNSKPTILKPTMGEIVFFQQGANKFVQKHLGPHEL